MAGRLALCIHTFVDPVLKKAAASGSELEKGLSRDMSLSNGPDICTKACQGRFVALESPVAQ